MYKLMITIMALGIGSVAFAGDEGKEETFKKLDSNMDGMLSQQEATADREVIEKFARIDTNRDGYVSAAEYRDFIAQDSDEKEEAE